MHAITIYALTLAAFALAWGVAWLTFIRRLLMRYAATAGLVRRMEAAEGTLWGKLNLWLEAKKTLAVMFGTSLFAAGKGAGSLVLATTKGMVVTGVAVVGTLQPGDLAPLQDKGLWSAFFGDVVSFHIIAALGLLGAFLTLKGKVRAAAIVPEAVGPEATVPAPGTAATGS